MSTIIENAVKGQRQAMEHLYEANKKKVYHIACSLLLDREQAGRATAVVFKELFHRLPAADVRTEEAFTQLAVLKVADYCKSKLLKKQPKAFRTPVGKSFALPVSMAINDIYLRETKYLLHNLPPVHRYVFVLHTVGGLDTMQIARVLKFESKTVQIAIDAEKANVERLQNLSRRGFRSSYEAVIQGFINAEDSTTLPQSTDLQVDAVISSIASPIEKKERQQRTLVTRVIAAIGICTVALWMLFVGTGGLSFISSGDTTATTETSETTDATETGMATELDQALTYYADIIVADYGTITVQLDQAAAPITAANFVSLAESGFYDGLTFHRIMEGSMIQGGDPEGNGTGGSDETIAGEFSDNGYNNPLSHIRGAISMARSDDYDSASSQFFIVHEDSTGLDGQYAVFGYVTEGMDVVDAVCAAADPTDDNGTISAEEQPIITSITIRTEEAS